MRRLALVVVAALSAAARGTRVRYFDVTTIDDSIAVMVHSEGTVDSNINIAERSCL